MNDLAVLGFWVFLGLVASVTIIVVFWAYLRKYQMRNEVVLKVLESGQSLDPETLDKLLGMPGPFDPPKPKPPERPTDPRAGYRTGGFIHFLMGFGTLLFAFTWDAGLSYPLIALGLFAIAIAFRVWRTADKAFREGNLPPLEENPARASIEAGAWFYFIGYGSILFGIIREGGLSYPIIGLGIAVLAMAFWTWSKGEKEARQAERAKARAGNE